LVVDLGIGHNTLFQRPNLLDNEFISNYSSERNHLLSRLVVQQDIHANFKINNNFYLSTKFGLQYAQWRFSYDQNTVSYSKTQLSDNAAIFQRNVSSTRVGRNEKFFNVQFGIGLGKKLGRFDAVSYYGLEKSVLKSYKLNGSFLESKLYYKLNKNLGLGSFLQIKLNNDQYSTYELVSKPIQYGVLCQYQLN
ncbi:MAG TPA: hypothetical protein PKD85_19755, partial [Saprospiraceae bacterium]|nr:hypothetical protein [Saprospiraceae bacterium]